MRNKSAAKIEIADPIVRVAALFLPAIFR